MTSLPHFYCEKSRRKCIKMLKNDLFLKNAPIPVETGPGKPFPTSYFLMRNVSLPLWMHIPTHEQAFLLWKSYSITMYSIWKLSASDDENIHCQVWTIVNKQEDLNFHTLIFSKVSLHTMSFCQAGRTAARPPKKQKWIFKKKFSFVHFIL